MCEWRRFPVTKSCNWKPVIGHPRDRAPITWQLGARRTNHDWEFCYRCGSGFPIWNLKLKVGRKVVWLWRIWVEYKSSGTMLLACSCRDDFQTTKWRGQLSRQRTQRLPKTMHVYNRLIGRREYDLEYNNLVPRAIKTDTWAKLEGGPALVTAVTFSSRAQKPLLNLSACAELNQNQDFLKWFRFRSPLNENARDLGTRSIVQ